FYDLIERNPIASAALKLRALTIFAPTNQAFQRYLGNKTVVLYHISTVATPSNSWGRPSPRTTTATRRST
ncbi:hypothetical protein quinque_005536, partial [Culex quinquefasciatus]